MEVTLATNLLVLVPIAVISVVSVAAYFIVNRKKSKK